MSAPFVDCAEMEDDPAEEDLADAGPAEPEEVWRSTAADPSPSHRRCVIHIDIDCFYAQVEMLERPELRDKPLGIQQKNIVVTSNYAARARGVGKCCLVTEALQACPDLVLVNGSDLTRYRRMSARIHRLLTRFSRRVERLGFDENFLDVTEAATRAAGGPPAAAPPGHALGSADSCSCGCSARLTAAASLAADVRRALREELGITSCAGIGFNKLLAKLAGATHKPDQQTVLFSGGVNDLLLSAGAVRALPGVGSRTATQLGDLGVRTTADLRRATPAQLRPLGSAATVAALRALAFGVDPGEVKPSSAALSIGVEDGFRRVDSVEECEVKLRELARRVMVLLGEDGRTPTVLKLSIRRYNREDYGRFRESRQTKVPPSLFARWREREREVGDRLLAEAMVLLKKMLKDEPFHLTLLGLAVTGFSEQSGSEKAGIARFVQKAASSATKRKSLDDATGDDAPPGGVDPAVWESLPPDIKSELLRDQEVGPSKKQKQRSIASFFDGSIDSKSDSKLAALDDRSDGAATCSDKAGDTAGDEVTRSRSPSPVELQDSDDDRGSGSDLDDPDSDSDDPGSPVIARSATTRREAELKVNSSTTERETLDAERVKTASPTRGGGSEDPVRSRSVGNSSPHVTSKRPQAPSVSTQANPAHRSHPSSEERADSEETPATLHRRVSAQSPSSSTPGPVPDSAATAADPDPTARCEDQTPGGGGSGSSPEDWDPDVFSQLPPDIQFELKMARRSAGRGAPSGDKKVSPRGPTAAGAAAGAGTAGRARNGSILKFFKK
ncbi:DNA polymerase iota-like [Amphibalanus amphitrite]|uniref:DNA polymerase iota-like n=1 Tax=Amphibalanus amphitrite TaxID=1232801 RepID=UPI001C9231D1|nr:DNA polymerase iota-like [Amphibalanus amphitrite]